MYYFNKMRDFLFEKNILLRILTGRKDCAKLCVLRTFVPYDPYVPACFRVFASYVSAFFYVPYVPSFFTCLTCPYFLCVLRPFIFLRVLCAFILLRVSRTLISLSVLRAFIFYVPNLP